MKHGTANRYGTTDTGTDITHLLVTQRDGLYGISFDVNGEPTGRLTGWVFGAEEANRMLRHLGDMIGDDDVWLTPWPTS